ncbi:MAG: aminotransferase class III-fold pyridoxal phosphate-dependent enzyme, partial [Lachnospiraceae bacterium]|nr:aminotransferase class III-fold pyridoxal phosphate-dependent enzyme [Lachnospiraceae bacterium]
AVKEDFPCVTNHRGIGLMQGLQFTFAPGDIVKAALKRGLILIAAASNVIRFLPPLIVEKEQIDEMAGILRESIAEVVSAQTGK